MNSQILNLVSVLINLQVCLKFFICLCTEGVTIKSQNYSIYKYFMFCCDLMILHESNCFMKIGNRMCLHI